MARVGMVTHSYYLLDPRVRREAETLAAAGHEVDVISLRRAGEPVREQVSGVRIYRIPITHRRAGPVRYVFEYGAGLLLAWLWLSVLSLRRRYKLVQVHTPPDLLVFSAIVPKLLGARVLLDLHDPMPEVMLTKFEQGSDHWLVRIVRWQEQVSLWFADAVITVTEQVKNALIGRGLPAAKVHIVMNFADDRLFGNVAAPPTTNPDGEANSQEEGPIIVFMGTLAYRYGVDLAIEALPAIRVEAPGVRLRIIGDGEERAPLLARAQQLGVADRVEFVGRVPIDRIPIVAFPAHIGVAPHRRDLVYDMCFPSKIYDYLALGLPVVAAWTESLDFYYGRDTLKYFESGRADDLATQILSVWRSPDSVLRMREGARMFLETHNWEVEGERYVSLVNRLVEPGEQPALITQG